MKLHSLASRHPGWLALTLALSVWLRLLPLRAADNRLDYRFEDYQEDDDRIHIQTHGAGFGVELNRHLAVRGQLVYDAISGATPTGGPPAPGDPQVPTVQLEDIRRAGSLTADFQYGLEAGGKEGRFLTSPQVAYSEEGDYESVGLALSQTVNFNQRNTAVTLGVARNFDRVKGFFQRDWADKDTTDVLLGVRQVVTPKTVATLNLTLGWADGYLTDPYKGVNFSYAYPISFYDPPTVNANAAELRPDSRFRQVVFAGLQHYVDAVRGAVDASYRFQHDDWGILAHTVELAWHQKLGRRARDMDPWVILTPFVRFHHQSAADFYAVRFAGDPAFPGGAVGAAQSDGFTILFAGDPGFPGDASGTFTVPAHPAHYSSDYRLSRLNTFTFGLSAEVQCNDHLSLHLAWKRYQMDGLDNTTLDSAYPDAHVFTVGASLSF